MRLMDLAQWRREIVALEPDVLRADDCAILVEQLAQLSKACSAAMARLAAKAEASREHCRQGFVDGADWLANAAGTSSVEARRALDAAGAVENCPETAAAWRSGEISQAQAAEIAKTEAVRPGSESGLL